MADTKQNKRQTSTGAQPPQKHQKRQSKSSDTAYISPVKRIKQAIESKATTDTCIISTVDALKEFIANTPKKNGVPIAKVVLEARVVWTSFHACRTGAVARMHLIDKQAAERQDEMYKILRDHYPENKRFVDADLITASLYGVDENTNGIPCDGAVIRIRNVWAMTLFMNEACQVTTSLDAITVESGP